MRLMTLLALAGSMTLAVPALAQQPPPEAMKCGALRGMAIAPGAIGEPSGGADIYATELVQGDAAGGSFCKINGAIDPVDPDAPDVNFQVNLPIEWNEKAIQFGGGGYNGALVAATGNVSFGAATAMTPLQRGYATYGSDSGHQSPSGLDGSFLLNDESLANFGGLQLKKTHDVAMALIQAFYGSAPKHSFIQGNSQGGHEALIAIQRWPNDYDGAIVTHPANPFSGLQMSGNMVGKAFYKDNGWVSPAGVDVLNTAVTAACDSLDGVADGLISNVAACDDTFKIDSLRCADGNAGEGCFSDAQIAGLKIINTRWESPVELQGGADGFARWPIFEGGDLYGLWGMGQRPQPSVPPTPVADFGLLVLADPLIRFAIVRDAAFNSMEFDPAQWAERLREVSELIDANEPDLTPFVSRGGKMLLMHGTIDFAITPHNTTEYYERVVAAMGQDKVDDFMRYYLVPGFGHGSGKFMMSWDPLTALEDWVERGKPPAGLTTTDTAKDTAGRTRPMCEYPAYPAYKADATDPDAAASFTCVMN
jgi:hypothetical protein